MRIRWPGIRLWRQEHAHEEHEADRTKDEDTSWRELSIWWPDPKGAMRYFPAQAEYALLETRSLMPRDRPNRMIAATKKALVSKAEL